MKYFKLLLMLVILFIGAVTHASSISIDNVTGTWDDGFTTYIIPDEEVTFDIRYTNYSSMDIKGMTNGFKVWTTGNSPFTPLNGELMYPGLTYLFDLVLAVNVYGANGTGADTLGMSGSALTGSGLYNGFNEIVLKLSTGGVQEGETLCIDSSWYPPSGTWRWSSGSTDIFPSWSGLRCYTALCPPCLGPIFTNCIDTLKNSNCETISYTFNAVDLDSTSVNTRYYIIDSPGNIDSLTGTWTYEITPQDLETYDTLIIGAYDIITCKCNTTICTSIIQFRSEIPADMNGDCSNDISDLVLLVAYMFAGGTPPDPLMSADMNGDSQIDISDMVWLVDYMFNGGPPPIG